MSLTTVWLLSHTVPMIQSTQQVINGWPGSLISILPYTIDDPSTLPQT